jgi:hypothetical protein
MQTRRQIARSLVLATPLLALFRPSDLLAQQDGLPPGQEPGNVFFSPCGRPFRAKPDAPYPVVDWFRLADTNGDDKIDRAEFMADTASFFKVLDRNADGVLSPQEVAFYEQRIAPEVLGMRVEGTSGAVIQTKPLLWKVQMPGGMGGGGMGGMGGMGGGGMGPDVSMDPGGGAPADSQRAHPYDASGKGAAPYGFFDEPEPITAADTRFRGMISRADFLNLADVHFKALDTDGVGYLTLDKLPKTPVQRRLNHGGERHRRR